MQNTKHIYTQQIKQKARELGFADCGIAPAKKLFNEEPRLKSYLQNNYHGQMAYMENHFEKRLDPSLLVDDAKSVIVVLLNYYTKKTQINTEVPLISKYAYGDDYHFIVKDKLRQLYRYIENEISPMQGRIFTDSAPVLERAWAVEAGLGWIGKNGLLINKKYGSFVFIGEIITTLEFEYDKPYTKQYCGTCTKCIDACPTNAIISPHTIDARKCISYLTIELKSDIPHQYTKKLNKWVFGCDICQDVCPWNKKIQEHNIDELAPNNKLLRMLPSQWKNLSKSEFNALFKNSTVKRTGFKKLQQNIGHIN
jgi:epoxyqueuosine reductase